ncbi:MAG TPA: hypothetical protein V6C89_07850 [Drouetiella sp.]
MNSKKSQIEVVSLPWSDGLLTANLWNVGEKTVVGVPELGLHCYGKSQSEAVLRLFSSLLKYYRQLKSFKSRLSDRALIHLELLTHWVHGIEQRMSATETKPVVLTNTKARR